MTSRVVGAACRRRLRNRLMRRRPLPSRTGAALRTAFAACLLHLACPHAARARDQAAACWVGTWAAAPVQVRLDAPPIDTTFRNIVHVSLGGSLIRIVVTNEYGHHPIIVDSVYIAPPSSGGAIDPGSSREVSFNGQRSVLVPAGAMLYSDPLPATLKPLSDLSISLHVEAGADTEASCHEYAASTNYRAAGDQAGRPVLSGAAALHSWCFVKGVEVAGRADQGAIVALGDSITDGAYSTWDANHRWTDELASRLQSEARTRRLSVLNEGIGGNRLLTDGHAPSAMARLDRDVIARPGARFLIIHEGINDVDHWRDLRGDPPTAGLDDLISAYLQIARRAHAHDIKVFGSTLTPNAHSKAFSRNGEALREALNSWIRSTRELDGVIDFDAALNDPADPLAMRPALASHDRLHPNDRGYRAMADAIDLRLFRERVPGLADRPFLPCTLPRDTKRTAR